jgi:hypothetical protein
MGSVRGEGQGMADAFIGRGRAWASIPSFFASSAETKLSRSARRTARSRVN